MKRLSPSRSKFSLRVKLATALTAVFTAGFSASAVNACDYCDQGDGGMIACDSCSNRVPGSPNGPIFKTLDALAGGVEKFLGFDKCGSSACDAGCDACDAGMMHELMVPSAPSTSTPHYHQPTMPSVPPDSYSQPPRDSVPYSEPQYNTEPQYIEPISPTPLPTPEPNGGIFDSLDDPFGDDEVRSNMRLRKVEPSSYQRAVGNAARATSQRTRSSLNQLQPRSNDHPASSRTGAASNSLKRAASRTATASRSSLNAVDRPIHLHHTRQQPVHQHHVHQPLPKQVPLSQAPQPQAQRPTRRQPTGQRHAWFPVNNYGQTVR